METKDSNAATVDELRGVAERISAIHAKMTCLTTLTQEQKAERPNVPISIKALGIFENRVAAAQLNRGQLPVTFDLPKLERDAACIYAITELLGVLGKLQDHLNDTLWMIGAAPLRDAATANAHLKVALATTKRLRPTDKRRKSRSSAEPATPAAVQPATSAVATAGDPAKQAA